LRFSHGMPKPPKSSYTYKVVVPKTEKEDIGWMAAEIPEASLVVYVVDNANAENRIPKHEEREAMVCSFYILLHISWRNAGGWKIARLTDLDRFTSPT
jgi:hypothetical protein